MLLARSGIYLTIIDVRSGKGALEPCSATAELYLAVSIVDDEQSQV